MSSEGRSRASSAPEPDVMGAYYQGRVDMMRSLTDILHREPSVLTHDWMRQCLVGAQKNLAAHLATRAVDSGDYSGDTS